MILRVLALASCLALSGSALTFGSEPAQLEDAEAQAIKYRKETTKRGHVRFRVTEKVHSQRTESLYETTFDEEKILQSIQRRHLGSKTWGDPTRILVTPTETVVDKTPAILVQKKKTTSPAKSREELRVLHPQPLGMDLNGANKLNATQLASVMIAPSARTAPKVSKEQRGGVDVWRLEYQTKVDGATVRVWIAPSQGYGVVAAEHHEVKKGIKTTIESQFKQYPAGNVWYPERVERMIHVKGELRRHQIIDVEEAKFDQPIQNSTFTMASLELKPGREVGDSTNGVPTLRVWDGKKLADSYEVPVPAPPQPPNWRQRGLLLAAVALALLAAFIGWRVVRRRKLAT